MRRKLNLQFSNQLPNSDWSLLRHLIHNNIVGLINYKCIEPDFQVLMPCSYMLTIELKPHVINPNV